MSAWASVKAPKAANLNEIMVDQEFLASDLSLAELVAFEEIQSGGSTASFPVTDLDGVGLADDDADFALALALQEELYEEERSLRPSGENSGNVRVAVPEYGLEPGALHCRGERYEQYSEHNDIVVDKAMRMHSQKKRVKGVEVAGRISAKDFKSTVQGVLDPATNLIIFKMLQNGTLSKCDTSVTVKTGKEASVFYGEPDFEAERNAEVNQDLFKNGCAVKIFKTTLNEFSNRSDYYDGDHRFGKFNKIGTTRDAIAKWAEKEFRNLMRVNKRSNIFAPEALTFKDHVVVMSFVGSDGVPAPQLREVPRASLTVADWTSAYLDTIAIIHSLYHDCKLVHGDLSEYNLLRHEGDTWAIDFGQAVDTSHPDHIAFMLRDIQTVNNFFEKCGVHVLNPECVVSVVLQTVAALDDDLSSSRTTRRGGRKGNDAYDESCETDESVRDAMIKRLILQSIE